MTLREALDLLELNERTLEQSMLESSLQNRLEHTELRHVLRVFEAYRKVNAFLNPSFNTSGDARMTIIDESVPGGPMLEVTKADVPMATATLAATLKNSDTFSDTMIETSTAWEALQSEVKPAAPSAVSTRRGDGVNLFVVLGLVAAAFGVGVVVLGPTMSLMLNRPVSSSAVPSVSSSPSPAPVVAAPPAATVVAPVAPIVQPAPVAPIVIAAQPVVPVATAQPVPPVVTVKPAPPAAVAAKPVAPAITKPATRPAVSAKPAVNTKPAVTPQPRATAPKLTAPRATTPRASAPRVTAPRVTTPRATTPRATAPRVTVQPRPATRRVGVTPRVSSSAAGVAVPSRPRINQRQFSQWDKTGAVLRYRSWALVPAALRGLSPSAFKAAVFVARDPASLPDIAR